MTGWRFEFDPETVEIPVGHFINGVLTKRSGESFEVVRPSDGMVYAEAVEADESVVDETVATADAAFRKSNWATSPPRDRGRILRRWAALIRENDVALSRLEAIGSTRPATEAIKTDIPATAEAIEFFSEFCDKLGGDILATRHDNLGMLLGEPYGVIAAITPWNFPLSMASWKAGAALAAGNAVVLKPSELTPFSTLLLAQLAIEAGVPPGIFNVVLGRGATTGQALVRHPGIRKVTFTGSTATGARIMCDAANSGIKPVTLELGGKSPQLVFDDAGDLAQVASFVARGILMNAGQVCVAGSRLIAHRTIADELLNRIIAEMKRVKHGVTWSPETTLPPIISKKQLARIESLVASSVREGASAAFGGGRIETNRGYFFQPTVLENLTSDNTGIKEEIFGPVLTVQTFDDVEEGITLADHQTYGLAAGVYTKDLNKAFLAMRRIAAGTVWVNRYGRSMDFIIPTGGYKASGIGKDLGRQAVEYNLRYKSVLMAFEET